MSRPISTRIILDEFSVSSFGSDSRAVSGDEIVVKDFPRIRIALSLNRPSVNRVRVRLIRSGNLLRTFQGSLPMEIDYEAHSVEPGVRAYYRIDVRGHGSLVSNPIFAMVKRGG